MSRRSLTLLVSLAAAALPSAALAAPVYIADHAGKVERLSPRTGHVRVAANDPSLGGPGGITIGRGGALLVSDFTGGAINKVDPRSGGTHLVSGSPKLSAPFDLQQAGDGAIYVADASGGPGDSGAVLKVNPQSGHVKVIADGRPFVNPYGIALGGRHKLYVADDRDPDPGPNKPGAILKVNIRSGRVSTVAKGGKLADPTGLEMGPGHKLYATDYSAAHATGAEGQAGAVFRINPKSGDVHTVRIGPPVDEAFGIDLDGDGRIIIPETPDAHNRVDIQRMTAAGRHLRAYKSPKITDPYGVAVGGH